MKIKYFKELFYIRCPHCGHESPVIKVKKAKAKLDKELVPGKPLCPQVKDLLTRLNLVCSECKRKEPEIDCRDAHCELKELLRKKDWLRENEQEELKGYRRAIEYGKGLTWDQIKGFEKIRQRILQGERKIEKSRPIKYCPQCRRDVPVDIVREGNYIVSRCSICGRPIEEHRA